MRRLDVVTVKGSATPIGIYTYDTNSKANILKDTSSLSSTTSSLSMQLPRPTSGSRISTGPNINNTPNKSLSVKSQQSVMTSPSGFMMVRRSSNDTSSHPNLNRRPRTSANNNTSGIKRRNSFYNSSHDPDEVITNDTDCVNLRSHISDGFLEEFTKGMNKYISGDWPTAKVHLEKSDLIMKENPYIGGIYGDGPAQTLLKYMSSYDYISPSNWQGFRPLTSK